MRWLTILLSLLVVFAASGCTKSSDSGVKSEQKTTYTCPMHPQIQSDRPGSCPVCGMDLVEAATLTGGAKANQAPHDHGSEGATIYTCPMHPEIQSDKPGDCPICGMDLVPKETSSPVDEAHAEHTPTTHATVSLTPRKQQLIGIELSEVKKRPLFKSIRAPGRVAFDPELYTAMAEYVEALRQWQRVKNSSLVEVRRSTNEMIRSSRIRLEVLGLSQEQIKDLGPSTVVNENLLLSRKGQDNWVYAEVFEMDLPYVKPDLSVEITAPFLQKRKIPGKVAAVDNVINPETRTAKVRIKIKSAENVRPESFVNVHILSPLGEHLSVPVSAVLDTGREKIVFVSKGDGQFTPRAVVVSVQTRDFAAVVEGLEEGEQVATSGNFMLDSESRLKGVVKSMQGSGHDH